MSDLEIELKVEFLAEAEQALSDAETSYLELESTTNPLGVLDVIFRAAHNIKGSSRAVGFNQMGDFTHQLENLILKMRKAEIPVTKTSVSLLLKCNDYLHNMLKSLKSDLKENFDIAPMIEEIKDFINHPNHEIQVTVNASPKVGSPPKQVAINTENEEPEHEPEHVDVPQVLESSLEANPNVQPKASQNRSIQKDENIRVNLSRIENLINYVGELVILQSVLKEQSANADALFFKRTINQLGKVTKEVQDLSMSLRMVPVKPVFQKLQRIVRDSSLALGKKIEVTFSGEDSELDKTIADLLGDPLVHLVRNSVDHGVEAPEARLAAGKSEFGQVGISAAHQNGRLVIEVKDDGGGIDPKRIIKKALEKKIISPTSQLSDADAINLIFHAGFSTKEVVTDISGRGVGMDVVKTNIEYLGGQIEVDSEVGKGSIFRIFLPLTLAIIDAMIVRIGIEKYVIPLNHVLETLNVTENDLKVNSSLGKVFLLRGESLPVFMLHDLLKRKRTESEKSMVAIIAKVTKERFVVIVDEVVKQSQIVVKQLGAELNHIKGFGGSTILGDGRPVLLLELEMLFSKQTKSFGKTKEQKGLNL